jgi:hypothetical protein
MAKILFATLIGFMFLTGPCSAQAVFNSSNDMTKHSLDTSVYDVHLLPFSNKIVIIYKNNKRQKILQSNVWGFENRFGQKFRRWNGDFYLIIDTGKFSIYLTQRSQYRSRSHFYYFSNGLQGDLYLLNKVNLHRVYNTYNCFLQKVDVYCKGAFRSCQDYSRKEKRIVVQGFFHDCP